MAVAMEKVQRRERKAEGFFAKALHAPQWIELRRLRFGLFAATGGKLRAVRARSRNPRPERAARGSSARA